jgi:hypothetical protein
MIIPHSQLYIFVQWKAISLLGRKHIRVMKYDLMNNLCNVANCYGMKAIRTGNLPSPLLMVLELSTVNAFEVSKACSSYGPGNAIAFTLPRLYSWKRGIGFLIEEPVNLENKENEQALHFENPEKHSAFDYWLEFLSLFNRAYEDDLALDFSLEPSFPQSIIRGPLEQNITFPALTA